MIKKVGKNLLLIVLLMILCMILYIYYEIRKRYTYFMYDPKKIETQHNVIMPKLLDVTNPDEDIIPAYNYKFVIDNWSKCKNGKSTATYKCERYKKDEKKFVIMDQCKKMIAPDLYPPFTVDCE
tara:strand:+ start:114 stop:485 length:372 start_codon:yes stop_codon:yes gene_type:complete